MNGLTLSRLFYEQAVRPILESLVRPEDYAAALIGWSSEVLGFDDEHSRDHNWGPRCIVFLRPELFDRQAPLLDQRLREALPPSVLGYPTNFGPSALGDQRVMQHRAAGPVDHFIQIERLDHYLQHFLGLPPTAQLSDEHWLAMPEHNLLGFTSGALFHDGPGELSRWRSRLRYYPRQVWLRRLAAEWHAIAEEEAFVGRCAARGDSLGALVITGRIVEHLMRLCFLMEQRYAPYSKWFGTAFQQLRCAGELSPQLLGALQNSTAAEREAALVQAYVLVAELHNQLGITPALSTTPRPAYAGRPGVVIHAGRFGAAIDQLAQQT